MLGSHREKEARSSPDPAHDSAAQRVCLRNRYPQHLHAPAGRLWHPLGRPQGLVFLARNAMHNPEAHLQQVQHPKPIVAPHQQGSSPVHQMTRTEWSWWTPATPCSPSQDRVCIPPATVRTCACACSCAAKRLPTAPPCPLFQLYEELRAQLEQHCRTGISPNCNRCRYPQRYPPV